MTQLEQSTEAREVAPQVERHGRSVDGLIAPPAECIQPAMIDQLARPITISRRMTN